MYAGHKVFGAVLATVGLASSSAALILTHNVHALHCRCCHITQHQRLLTETPYLRWKLLCYELQCLVFVCAGTCVWVYMKTKGVIQLSFFR